MALRRHVAKQVKVFAAGDGIPVRLRLYDCDQRQNRRDHTTEQAFGEDIT